MIIIASHRQTAKQKKTSFHHLFSPPHVTTVTSGTHSDVDSTDKHLPTYLLPLSLSLLELKIPPLNIGDHISRLPKTLNRHMGVPSDDAVLIQKGKKLGEPYVITVNCPDKTGLGCDICHIILEFGLYPTKADVSTDGIWCYVVLWVIPHPSSPSVKWANLKERLLSVCPSCTTSIYWNPPSPRPSSSPIYLLKFCCCDRRGLLHDVTRALDELELSIQRVKVTTTPDGCVLDLFFIRDNL